MLDENVPDVHNQKYLYISDTLLLTSKTVTRCLTQRAEQGQRLYLVDDVIMTSYAKSCTRAVC